MKRPYTLTPAAKHDLDEHFLFIGRQNPTAASRFFDAADATFLRLASMPGLGERQICTRSGLVDLRAWQVHGFENYVIFYRPIEHGVEIVRVLHAARDIAAIFEDET